MLLLKVYYLKLCENIGITWIHSNDYWGWNSEISFIYHGFKFKFLLLNTFTYCCFCSLQWGLRIHFLYSLNRFMAVVLEWFPDVVVVNIGFVWVVVKWAGILEFGISIACVVMLEFDFSNLIFIFYFSGLFDIVRIALCHPNPSPKESLWDANM